MHCYASKIWKNWYKNLSLKLASSYSLCFARKKISIYSSNGILKCLKKIISQHVFLFPNRIGEAFCTNQNVSQFRVSLYRECMPGHFHAKCLAEPLCNCILDHTNFPCIPRTEFAKKSLSCSLPMVWDIEATSLL